VSVPIVSGASGLTGRPRVRPVVEHDPELDDDGQPVHAALPAMPGGCLRRLHSFRDPGCPVECEGIQRDGSCLCDIIKARDAQVTFEIDHEGYWCAT
jgi:hypothetical protein